MVASHTTSSSDVLCSRMMYMMASHTTSSSDVLCSRMVYMVASHTTSGSDVFVFKDGIYGGLSHN